MLGQLFQRIENSAAENETFVQYFESYIKIWTDHANTIEKNTKKWLTPIRLEHEKQGSAFKDFLTAVENMDLVYIQNQKTFVKQVQNLVNQNLSKVTVQMRGLVNQNHTLYKTLSNRYRDNLAITAYLFDKHKALFEKLESEGFSSQETDCFLSE